MSEIEKRLWAALERAEADLAMAVEVAKAAKAAGNEDQFICARQSANEAYERVMCLSHDVASWASAHGA
jgi:hypothetical protein